MATDYVDQVAGAIIKQLQEGTAPWQKPWKPGERFMPYNPTTGNEYRGANALWLMSQAESKGFGDARWMTYRQAQEQDAQVTKGQKGTAIQYWKWQGLEPVKDASGKPVLDQAGEPVKRVVRYERPRVWSAMVFNAQQIDGLPPAPDRPAMAEWERHEKAEAIMANSGVPVLHAPGDRAFYRLSEDRITLPERGQFASADRYYATALHEMGHATGHPSRLARDMAHPFGSEGYAREELRAEIGSMMLGEQLGIGHDPSQHVAYVGSWIKALQQDPREVFRAAADAEKITKMVRSFELVQEQEAPGQVAIASVTTQAEQGAEMDEQQAAPAGVAPVPTMIRATSPSLEPPTTERTYIAVPYAEKDDAKQLGAKWDRAEKSWFVPAGVDTEAFAQWMPAKGSVHIAVDADPVEQFSQALRDAGLKVDGAPKMDGELHRVPVEGDAPRSRSGAYKGHLDGHPAGFIQNHKTGTRENWKSTGQAASALTVQDRAQMAADAAQKRHDRAHVREQQAERTAQQVDAMWAAATPVQAHPYLADKGVQDHGLRQGAPGQTISVNGADGRSRELSVAGQLFVPVADETGKLASLQFIRPDGAKMFMPDGKVESGHYVIGDARKEGPVLIAEGFATAATLHEMTGLPAIVAFNAGNLRPVAEVYRALDPTRAIYVAGDDDKHREAERDGQGRPKVNVGRVKAEEAAAAIGGQAVFPDFPDNTPGTDWNDLAKAQGRTQAAAQLRGAIAVADREQTVQGMSLAREDAGQEQEQDRSLSKSLGQALGRIGKAFGRDRDKSQVQEMGHGR